MVYRFNDKRLILLSNASRGIDRCGGTDLQLTTCLTAVTSQLLFSVQDAHHI